MKTKMASSQQSTVPQLFTELRKLANDGEFSKAQKTANKSKKRQLSLIFFLSFIYKLFTMMPSIITRPSLTSVLTH